MQLVYAIGVAQPVSVRIDTFGTGTVAESQLEKAARQIFDLRPAGIIQMLDLKRPNLPSNIGLRSHGTYRY